MRSVKPSRLTLGDEETTCCPLGIQGPQVEYGECTEVADGQVDVVDCWASDADSEAFREI